MKTLSPELQGKLQRAVTSPTRVVFSGAELQAVFASPALAPAVPAAPPQCLEEPLSAAEGQMPVLLLPEGVEGIPAEWVQALRVAADVLDLASMLPIPSVKVSPPPEWGVGSTRMPSAEGWANTVALAQKFREMLAPPTLVEPSES